MRYFLKVLDEGSVKAAAQELGVAQPTVSQAIKALEREVGTHLFFRIGRGMVPTSAARAMAGSARKTLRDLASAASSVRDDEGHVRGRLDIAVLAPLAGEATSKLVTAFHRNFSKATVQIEDLEEESSAMSMIRDGHCDVVITHLPLADPGLVHREPAIRRLESREIGTQEYWFAVSDTFADVVPEGALAWQAIPDVPLVVVPRGGGHVRQIISLISTNSQARPVSVVVQHREARLPLVLAGLGATFIERGLAQRAAAQGAVVRPLDPPLLQAFGVVFDPATVSPLGRAFVELDVHSE